MGVQDRDWYIQKLRKRDNYREKAGTRRSQGKDERDAEYFPKPSREVPRNTGTPELRDVPGVHWHWTVKVIVYGLALLATLIVIRQFKH